MEQKKPTHAVHQGVVQAVFDDFISRLEKDSAIDSVVVQRLRESLQLKHYSAEKLRTALFLEDTL